MSGTDVEASTLQAVAAASGHAFQQAIVHIAAEIKAADGNYEPLMNTLLDEGPYAYTLIPELHADGSVKLPILTTREQIAEAYAMIRGSSDLLEVTGLTEIRGSWYLFQDSIAVGRRKGDDQSSENYTLGLFPSGRRTGITGELVWFYPRSMLGAPGEQDLESKDPAAARRDAYERYARYLDALQSHDVDGILEDLHDGVASAVRDYVNSTGTLTELEGKDAHRAYYDAFFEKYAVRSVQPVAYHTDARYVFAELRMTVEPTGADTPLTYHTAEYYLPSKDGRFIARIGHGTEPVDG
jgi:hypothetical protein